MLTFRQYIHSYQHAIVSVSILVFCVLAFLFAVFPALQKTIEIVREYRDVRQQTSVLQKKVEMLTSLSEDTLRGQLATVLSAVPADRSFATLFETVEGVARQTGVTVLDMSIAGSATLATPSAGKVSAADKKLGTRTLPFTVVVSGTLPALQQFITLAPNVRRLLRVRVFSISFPKSERPINISVEMDAFYEPLPVSLGTPKSSLTTLKESDEEVIAKIAQMPHMSESGGALPPPLVGTVKENPFSP